MIISLKKFIAMTSYGQKIEVIQIQVGCSPPPSGGAPFRTDQELRLIEYTLGDDRVYLICIYSAIQRSARR